MEKIIAIMPERACIFRLILAALLAGAGPGASADFADGFAAYQRGDYATALREFQPLAEQGDAGAQNILGGMYAKGQGVPQDDVYAHMWANIAASGSDKNAVELRSLIAEAMTPPQITEAQRLARECVRGQYRAC